MKTRALIISSTVLSLFLFFNSCSKDTDDVTLEASLCNPTSDYYFTGILDNSLDCWNKGNYNYQVYHGGGATYHSNGDTAFYWTTGLDQWPIPDINKTIYLNVEVAYDRELCTEEQFYNTFQTGSYSFQPVDEPDKNGIELVYSVNGTYYNTAYGPQDDSYIDCVEVSEAESSANSEALNVGWEFSCNLYDNQGNFFKKLEIGKMRADIIWLKY